MSSYNPTRRDILVASGVLAASALVPALPAAAAGADELIYVDGATIDTLDPVLQVSRSTETLLLLLYNRMVKWADTSLSEIVPDLATEWSVSEDELEWTFKLRDDVVFQDGTPFNADAVKAHIDRIKDPALGSGARSIYEPISEVTVVDEHTVLFKLAGPYPLLEILIESSAAINSPAAVAQHGSAYGRNPVGTGPYRLDEWSPGEFVRVVRNDDYFGDAGNFKTITARSVPESGARAIELEAGNADIVNNLAPEAAPRITANPNLQLKVQTSTLQVFLALNCTKPPFDNPKLRNALNYAIDREAIIDSIIGGYAGVPDNIIAVGGQAHRPLTPYPFDPDRAKAAFDEAYPGGFNETLTIWTPQGRYQKDKEVCEAVQAYLNAIGLRTDFRVMEWATFIAEVSRAMPGTGTGFGSDPSHIFLIGTSIPLADMRFGRWFETGQGLNWNGYSNEKVDDLIRRARHMSDQTARMALYDELARYLWEEDSPHISLFNQQQLIGLRSNISDFEAYSYDVPILNSARKA